MRVARGKMRADVPVCERAEQGIGQGVENHVAVAQIIWLKLKLSLTLNMYLHVLLDMGDAAAGAIDDALG